MIPISKRNIAKSILLSIVTFGIYSIYWQYLLIKNVKAVKKDDSGFAEELLCYIFVPFYCFYWWFNRGRIVKDEFASCGRSAKGNKVVYLILGILGLEIVAMAIMQNDFNSLPSEIADESSPQKEDMLEEGDLQEPIDKRNIAISIVLSIVTFGIYSMYWQYLLIRNTKAIKKEDSGCAEELLCNLFVPFYGFYWWFTRGKTIKDGFANRKHFAKGNEVVYLILRIFRLELVAMAIMQSDFNSLPTETAEELYEQSNSMLEVRNLWKRFGNVKVLKGVNFTLERGEVLSIIGASGGGKTTLLRCLNFLEKADRGVIFVNGKSVYRAVNGKKPEVTMKAQLSFGLVFQQFNLFPQYNVLDNLMLAPKLRAKKASPDKKESLDVIKARAEALLASVGLSEKAKAYPCELSGGQQQRVAIARAIVHKPQILFADEPTAELDSHTSKVVAGLFRQLVEKEGITVLMTTHDSSLMGVGSHLIELADGEVVG